MNLYNSLTKDRYDHHNSLGSLKFIDFMITDMEPDLSAGEAGTMKGPDPTAEEPARIIRSVFSYSRYEPLNPYIFHKIVPSARNVHPNEAYLVCGGWIFRYQAKKASFEKIGYSGELKGRLWLVIVSELWRIMKFYGEFGFALSLLDAGHILAELRMKLVRAGYENAKLCYGAPEDKLYEKLGLPHNSVCIHYLIDLSDYLDKSKTNIKAVEYPGEYHVRRRFCYDEEIKRYPRVSGLLSFRGGIRQPIRYEPTAKKLNRVLQYEQARSSGHSTAGLFSTLDRLPEQLPVKYAAGASDYLSCYMGDKQLFRVVFLYRNMEGEDCVITATGKGFGKAEKLGTISRRELLHDSFEHINMESMPLVVYILYKTTALASEETAIIQSHIGAGEISQYISLMAAGDGFFARPMKNFNDMTAARLVKCEEEESILYSTIIGRENYDNYNLLL